MEQRTQGRPSVKRACSIYRYIEVYRGEPNTKEGYVRCDRSISVTFRASFCNGSWQLSKAATLFLQPLAGGFTLGDLPDKSSSQVFSLLPPGTCFHFIAHWVLHSKFQLFILVDLKRISPSRALALSACQFVREKSPLRRSNIRHRPQ